VRDLGALAGGTFSEAVSVNGGGVAVGFSTLVETFDGVGLDFGDRHAVVFQNGTVTDLTPDLPIFSDAVATGINTAGTIVGFKGGDAFIWENGVGTDLNTLIPSDAGVVLSAANGINDKGQIAATGSPKSNPNRITVGVLLTPQ